MKFLFSECAGCGIGQEICTEVNKCSTLCGVIASVNYPFNYNNWYRCRWHLKFDYGKYVSVEFIYFDINDHVGGCQGDYLEFIDVTLVGTRISKGRFCNLANDPPAQIVSSWNEFLIDFATDDLINSKGFYLKYTALKYQVRDEIYQAWLSGSKYASMVTSTIHPLFVLFAIIKIHFIIEKVYNLHLFPIEYLKV